MKTYPANITPDGDQFLVTFPDVPEALTGAETREEAEREALDALVTALDEYARRGRAFPNPSPVKKGQAAISIPALIVATDERT